MEEYLDKLNPQQRDAVLHTDTPQLVIAGAGSGKTRVLTYKIVHLLASGFRPNRILALTFTNKAAAEMRQRITDLMGSDLARRLWMGTFHSIFLRILHQHYDKIGYKANFTIYDTADSKALIKLIIKDMSLDDKIYKPSVVLNAISMAKNALVSPDAYAANRELMEIDKRSKKPLIYAIYSTYRKRCFLANAMDFDDILYFTYKLFRDNQDILNHYREYFQYVLVDEYQDTNYAQHLIIRQLTEGQNNLSVVGDDAQSIYSFRGANIGNILSLKDNYPNLSVFKLERNYRSTKNIIEAANSLIAKNTRQIPKQIFSENEKGEKLQVIKSYSDFEEGYLIANKISSSKFTNHDNFSDYAVLYRTNAQSRILEESLRKRNIPYRIYGGLSFYQRKEIKDALAYFRMAINPDDDESLRRIINFPARGIGETTINKITRTAIDSEVSMWTVLTTSLFDELDINSGTKKKLSGFRELIEDFIDRNNKDENAYDLAEHIIKRTTLLSSLISDRTPESISKQENLNELLNGVRIFVENNREENREDNLSLRDYMSEVSLATDADTVEGEDRDSVTLMTVHAAKGLEFKNVLIVGVEEDLFPSALSTSSAEEIEEERRLLYVAITRAKKSCVLSYATSRYRNGQTVVCRPSRFLGDIHPDYLDATGAAKLSVDSRMVSPVGNYFSKTTITRKEEPVRRPAAEERNPKRWLSNTPPSAPSGNRSVNSSEFGIHNLSEINTGDIIEHLRFGKGKIIDKEIVDNNERIIVEFPGFEVKTLLLKFARFKIVR